MGLLHQDGADETMIASSLGKMPIALVRRLISPFGRSIESLNGSRPSAPWGSP